jgi:hypothetical protein
MLSTKNIKLELITEDDAEMILKLRTDPKLNRFLSKTDPSIEKQKGWIREYKKRESKGEDYYFSIKLINNNEVLGYIRVYNINKKDRICEWGSWIMKDEKPVSSALESVILIYNFIFNTLKFEKAVQSVIKENKKVLLFHKAYGVKTLSTDETFEYLVLEKDTYLRSFLNTKLL